MRKPFGENREFHCAAGGISPSPGARLERPAVAELGALGPQTHMPEILKLVWLIPLGLLVYGCSLLFWPVFRLFDRTHGPREQRLRRIFFVTLFFLLPLGVLYGLVALLGRFDHNWLIGTLWFHLINLVSLICSIVACLQKNEPAA